MKLDNRIQEKLNERKWYHRLTAITLVLSLLCAFFVPLDLVKPGFAAMDSDVPAGAYSIENDISNVSISNVQNGSASGSNVTGNVNADDVSFSMTVDFVINDRSHDKIDTSKPYIYLPIAKEELEVLLLDESKKTGDASDSSSGWTTYRQNHPGVGESTGTYEIFPTGDGSYGYIVLHFNQNYIDYVKQSNGIVTGSLKFDGKITRDAAQSGDKEVSVGNASITVDFDDREPSLGKSVSQSADEIGCPVLTWTITVNDLYETNLYTITDDMLAEAYDFSTNPDGICYLEDGQIQFNDTTNHIKTFTITYKTRVTPEELSEKISDYTISNTVKLNGVDKATATDTIHPNSEPSVSKSGIPDYLYYGDRSGEATGKNYIYWTVNVNRNYGLSLAGYTLNDTLDSKLSNLAFVSAADENGTALNLSDLFADTSGTAWTFKDTVTEDKVTLVYRTEVSEDADGITNSVSIGSSDPSTPSVNYQKNLQHRSNKWGNYVAIEENGEVKEYVDWTIEIYAVDGANETINDYSVYDSAFDTSGFTWQSIEAKNDGQNVAISVSDVLTGSGTTKTIVSTPTLDYLKVTYRVPLGTVAGRDATHGGKASNSFKVEKDTEETIEIDVPSLAGQSTVSVNKYWANNDDPNKGNTTATFTLYCKVGENGTWQQYSTYKPGTVDTITISGTQSGTQSFTDLPAYDIGANDVRTPLYYKVKETITVPSGVTDLYQRTFTSGNAESGGKGIDNPTFGITNTWEGTNVEGVKHWRDDEGHESERPTVSLTLRQRKVNSSDEWTDVSIDGVENPKNATAASDWKALWTNLPTKDSNGNLLEYQVVEKNPPSGYTVNQDSNTSITNVYNNMTITAEKFWDRVDSDDDKPDSVTLQLSRTTNPNDENSWENVNDPIVLNKSDYDSSTSVLKWQDLPKTDGSGNAYYYKLYEIQSTAKQQEFDVDYWVKNGSYGQYYVNATDGSAEFGVTNRWKKTNITVTKQWQDDRGNEFYRPNILFVLERSTDWNDWVEIDRIKLVNDGTGNYKPEGSGDDVQAGPSYTWKGLPAGDNIRYRVRELAMYERQRGGDHPGTETSNIDTGYDTYYGYVGGESPTEINSTADQSSRNAIVINKSNMITIRVDKVWEGIPADYRADMVGYRLYRWTETQYNTLTDEEKYGDSDNDGKDDYKFSDKYAFKSTSGESDTIYWTWMLTEDENGEKYYYGLKEIAVKNQNPAIDNPTSKDDYTVDRSSEFDTEVTVSEVVDQNQTITVKNTWKNMNVSISKVWEDGTNVDGYTSITMKLMQKEGEDGTWTAVSGATEKTVTAANNWRLDDAWTKLPRETAQGQKIYYRVEEVNATKSDNTVVTIGDNEDFYTRPDAAGINATGDSVVTNTPKKINIGLLKHWVSTQGTAKPTEITVTLMASTNGGASWVSADQMDSSITDAVKTLTVNGDNDLSDSWSNLPTKKTVGGVERDVIYKLVEGDVSGYSASYSSEAVNTNSTVTITNTEVSPYTKKAANPVPSILPSVSTYDENEVTKTRLDSVSLVNANDGILQNNTLSSEEITNVDTAIVNINGVDTECYLFKWRIDMETNQTDNNGNIGYVFTDTLTDGSVFYDDCGAHGIKVESNSGGNDGVYLENWSDYYDAFNAYGFAWNTHLSVSYNSSKTQIVFDTKTPSNGKKVSYITYYTATPKSIVDSALESTGEFSLTNRIQEEKESTPNEIELHVTGGDNVGYIDKINNTATGTSNGYAAMKDGTAHYTLDVNKDSKYLSSGNTVSVTDIFRILDYTPEGGAQQTGLDVTAVPAITNVGVFYYDTDGKRSRVDPSQYSYSTEAKDGYYETSEDYSDKFTNANLLLWGVGNGVLVQCVNNESIPSGLEVILNYRGTPNADASIKRNTMAEHGVDVEVLSDTYDSSGIVKVKLTFTRERTTSESGQSGGELELQNYAGSTPATTVDSAILKTSTSCKNYITKFTLPDGGHYEIMYDYVIKNADGTSLDGGSILTLQNEASVHTSGGDKSDDSRKTTYCVQKSDITTRVGQNFEIVKVDIGNQSIDDLNAEFKFAKYDTDQQKWIYADTFQYKTITAGSTSYLSDTLHEALYTDGLTETEGVIPSSAANMVLSGSYEIELDRTVLYKVIEVKAPDNHPGFNYPKTPYENGDHTVSGNADNTYYFLYNESGDGITALTDDQLTTLATSAGIDKNSIKIRNSNDPSVIVTNVRQIDIGAEKTWEQDPNSAVNDVEVAVQLLRSDTKDIKDAVLVANQKNLLAETDKANFDDNLGAYILKKADAWKQSEIWLNLPNGNIETGKPYYYFVKEVGYKIGATWYTYDSTSGKYVDSSGNVWHDASNNSAEYKPSYTDDAISSSGVIRIVNSRKLLVKKQWQDKNGNAIANPPVSSIDFNLYGITSDGTEVKITLPDDRQKLTSPNWEIEVPQDLISGEGINYIKYRVEEVTELEDYIVSDVYALNGNTGVMYLINKNTNPTSVDVNVEKTWADGNDAHDTDDAVTFTLYQFTGKQTVNQAFIENFISRGKTYNGVTQVTGVTNPVTLDGTETDAWQYAWKNLPFRGGADNAKLQYFVIEEQSDTTKDDYIAIYTLDGNTTYKAERTLNVTNKQPGVLVVKKQWRDKTQQDTPLISNAKNADVQVKLYRKAKSETQIVDAEATDILTKYGLTDADNLVTGITNVTGLSEEGIITLGTSNAWTVSLKGLDDSYNYYIVEADGKGYTVAEYTPQYTNEGQIPGSDNIMTVDNFIEGETITVKARKTWSYTDDDGTIQTPTSITLNLQQYDTVNQKWVTIQSQTVTASSGSGWEAEWADLPASKRYQVIEEVPDGWLVSYGTEDVDTSGETEIRSYPVTNVLDTGELKVKKNWLANDPGNATSVTVELWRQAYDGNEPYTAAPENANTQSAQTQSVSSLPRGMFSMRRVQAALAETQTDYSKVQTEVVAQAPVQMPFGRPLTNSKGKIRLMGSGTDSHGNYVSLDVNSELLTLENGNVQSLCSGYDITGIGYVFEEAPVHFYGIKTYIKASNVTFGELYLDSGYLTSSELYYDLTSYQGWTNNVYYDGIPSPIQGVSVTENNAYNAQNTKISIKEIRFYYTPVGPTVSITNKPDNTSVISGDTATLTATTSAGMISWASSDSNVATVDNNGNITFKQVSAVSEVTITASATDAGTTNSDSVTYTVTPFSITDKATITTDRTEGNTVDLDANASASWSSSDTNVATVNANGEVTFTGNGTVTITATHGGATDTISFTVSSLGFTPTVTPETVHVGGTATLGADLAGVTWAIKPTGNTGTAELTGNTVTATGVGDVTLIGTRGSVTQEVTLHIASMKVTYNNEDIIPEILTVNVRSSIPVVNVVGTSSGQTTDDQIAVYDPATRTVTVGEKLGEATITITDEGGGSLTFKVKTEVTEASANIPSTAEKVQDITISTTANWLSASVSGLPKTDGLGHTYRYFIKEEATGAFIPVAYSTSGQGAELSDTLTQLSLTNASQQSESTTLPESGSTGTRIYYITGAMLLLLAAAGYATYSFKRRRWSDG